VEAVAGFCIFYLSALYFMSKLSIKQNYTNLLPFLWLSSFGYAFSQLYLLPTWRCFDAGASFGFFALAAAFFYGDLNALNRRLQLTLGAGLSILMGIFIYSDPYFLYFFVAPLMAFTVILKLRQNISKRRLAVVLCIVGFSFLVSQLVSVLAHRAGIEMATSYPIRFVAFDDLFSHIAMSLHSLLLIFGADFFGHEVFKIEAISGLLNSTILVLILIRVWDIAKQVKVNQQNINSLWMYFFGAVGVFVFIPYSLSTVSVDLSTYRYFIMTVLSFILFLTLQMGRMNKTLRQCLATVIIAAVTANLVILYKGVSSFNQPGAIANKSNSANLDIIHTIEKEGFHKGYANYWQGSINTYLSNGRVKVLPTICPGGQLITFHWLIDDDSFSSAASKSFYIIDPTIEDTYKCSDQQLQEQFGQPTKSISVDGRIIQFYAYDIRSKMPS
jgi:hypothetical protein